MRHSVVIPLYNKEAYVKETLQSLYAQTKLPDELIIVDDASTDKSLEVVKSFFNELPSSHQTMQVELVSLKNNFGPGHARNIGFEKTNGELISFLDADDLYEPACLEKVNQAMAEHGFDLLVLGIRLFPSGDVYPDLHALKHELEPVSPDVYEIPHPLRAVTSPHFIMGVGSNVVVKRKWLEPFRYNVQALLNEGIDYWYRVVKNITTDPQARVGLLTGNYLQVREVPGSLSRKKYTHWKELEMPPSLSRYQYSKDPYDRRLMRMLGERWMEHAMESLPSARQKFLFMLHYRSLAGNFITRKFRQHK